MPVRRVLEDGTKGYGVIGSELGNPNSVIIVSLRDVCNEIPRPTHEPFAPFEQYVLQFVYLRWRFSVNIGIAEMESIKQYFTPLGKSQFGRYVISAYGYVRDEGFISYAKQKSAMYSCCIRYFEGSRDDSLPCDEPQISGVFTNPTVGGWTSYSNSSSAFAYSGFSDIGDGFALSLPKEINAAIVGLTYEYSIVSYTVADIVQANFPPATIF